MNIKTIDRVRKLRRQVAGRIVQATDDVQRALDAARHPWLVPLIEAAQRDARAQLEITLRRQAQQVARNEGRAGETDAETDIVLATMHDTAKRYARRMAQHPKGKAGKRILRVCFRRGLAAVINAPYEEEVVLAEYIHEQATTALADDFRLLGLSDAVDELGRLVPQFRDALAMEDRISAAEVAAAYEAMQVAWFRLAFGVVAMVDDAEAQAALLAPIFDQDDRLAAVYAARRSGQPIAEALDPDAEALLEAEAEAEAAARAEEVAAGVEGARAEGEGDVEVDDEPIGDAPDAEPPVGADAPEADGGAAEGDQPRPLRPLPRSDVEG